MKKKFGFTLAEVLITLGIIGVVAALTAPALVKNSGQAKIGPALAKFVNTFETGMETMMTEENISTLKNNVGGSAVLLSKYMIMTPIDATPAGDKNEYGAIYNATGNQKIKLKTDKITDCIVHEDPSYCTDENGDGVINGTDIQMIINKYAGLSSTWQLKDGSVMYVLPVLNYGDAKGAYKGVVAEILIDIDGNKDMNKAGKDVFGFLLDASGVLIPVGSNAYKYLQEYGENALTESGANAECALDDNFDNNFACTGKIADNGWKADY